MSKRERVARWLREFVRHADRERAGGRMPDYAGGVTSLLDLLREQEREPDVASALRLLREAGNLWFADTAIYHDSDREAFVRDHTRQRHIIGTRLPAAIRRLEAALDVPATERWHPGTPPTSTSEGAECTCAVGLSEKCDVHGATPPEPESEDDDGGFDSVTVRAGRAYTYCSECGATEVLGHLRSCPRAEPESEEA